MENTRVLFVPTANAGVSYWRMWNFAQAMHRSGTAETQILWYDKNRVDLAEWELELTQARAHDDYMGQYRLTQCLDILARQSNAIVFGLVHSLAGLDIFTSLVEMRKAGHLRYAPIIMELDDNILAVPTQNPAFHTYEPGTMLRDIAVRQMKAADGIVVSTQYLVDICGEYNKNVFLAQNSIDWQLWGKCKNDPRPGVRIGWAGGKAHDEDLSILEKVIPAILDKYPETVFCFVNGASAYIRNLKSKYGERVEIRPWVAVDKYPQMIASLDWNIALAPLVDSSFNRAKSNLRWLEAGALGIPTVASNVGHFKETIEDGTDGLLCDTANDFVDKISMLVENKATRKRLGKKAKRKIALNFTVEAVAKNYVGWIQKTSNDLADKDIEQAQADLQEREHEQGPNPEPGGASCGRPAAEPIRQLLQ